MSKYQLDEVYKLAGSSSYALNSIVRGLIVYIYWLYSVQIRDVGRFLAKFNPWTNTFGNRLVRLHCWRIHPFVKLSTPKVYSCSIVENKRFELLKMNLISPDTLFEICTYMYLKHVRVS